jgi:hypothetical protein
LVNKSEDDAKAFAGPCYWPEVAFRVDGSAGLMCVFATAAFTINAARAGMQTHISFMDLLRLTPCRGWEAMATITIKQAVKRAKRLMGLMG